MRNAFQIVFIVSILLFFQNNKSISQEIEEAIYSSNDPEPYYAAGKLRLADSTLISSTIFTKYNPRYTATVKVGNDFIRMPNITIREMAKLAFGSFTTSFLNNGRVVLEGFNNTQDSLTVGVYSNENTKLWSDQMRNYTYCLEVKFPRTISRKAKMDILQKALNDVFAWNGIEIKKEMRIVSFWELRRVSKDNKFESAGGRPQIFLKDGELIIQNKPILFLLQRLPFYVEDKTGIQSTVDISITGDLGNANSINKSLSFYGLELVEKKSSMEMIVIKKLSVNVE